MKTIIQVQTKQETLFIDNLPKTQKDSEVFLQKNVVLILKDKSPECFLVQEKSGFIFRTTDGTGWGHSGLNQSVFEAVKTALSVKDNREEVVVFESFNEMLEHFKL